MIRLTRLGQPAGPLANRTFILNCDLIQTVEATPDTLVTLQGGEKLLVRESVDEVVRLAVEFRRKTMAPPPERPRASALLHQEQAWT